MMKMWVRPMYRKSWSFRVAAWGGVFSLRLREFDCDHPTSLWWRNDGGFGWQVKFCERATDYRLFSERMGITKRRKVGPLTIKRLTP